MVTKEQVLDALRSVQDPDLHQDIVSLGFVTQNAVCDGAVKVTINLTTPACPVKDKLKQQAEDAIRALPGVASVAVEMTAVTKPSGPPRKLAEGVRHIIAVSSGKGGVGKSTVAVNLACALGRLGAKVGLLDADVYGPDVPMMMGIKDEPETANGKLLPLENHGIKTMWGQLDYLIVDMPPGTGDAQLSLAQIVPLSGAVLVTTPQAVSTFDVGKAITMFKQVNVEILGIVENMSGMAVRGSVAGAKDGVSVNFAVAGKELRATTDVFGSGGADRLAVRHGFPVVGRLPLEPAVRAGGDLGAPVVVAEPDSVVAKRFIELAGKVAQRVAIKSFASLPVLQ
jgi:ATP-binding protein involved in chromosome partitioning